MAGLCSRPSRRNTREKGEEKGKRNPEISSKRKSADVETRRVCVVLFTLLYKSLRNVNLFFMKFCHTLYYIYE